MPALSPTMEEGTLAKWLVKEGDTVTSGDILAEIETDKATMEFEAVDEGTIGKILVPEGTDEVKVGTVIALIGGRGRGRVGAPAPQAPARSMTKCRRSRAGACRDERRANRSAEPVGSQREADVRRSRRSRQAPRWSRTTVREALRDAMAEEMRRDERVFVMGEEVAEYQGAYKVTQGLLDEFGDRSA